MSVLLRAVVSKAGIAVLGGCCLAVVVVAAASATARTKSSVPPVDHQLCYSAAGVFKIPTNVVLKNQFSPNGFVPKISNNATVHCNPVIKTLPSGKTYKVTNPAAHLVCFPMTPQKPQPTKKVFVGNQFGQATLVTKQPNRFCVPSWKSLTGPPNRKPTTPPGLNHFTCYPVDLVSGGYKPPTGIMLRDEFTNKNVPVQVNRIPRELCLPTVKIVGTQVFRIINPTMHLLCFSVTKTPIRTPVWDENQFGTSKMAIRVTQSLCLPSTKKVVAG